MFFGPPPQGGGVNGHVSRLPQQPGDRPETTAENRKKLVR
jgi:hypothetical protein